MKMEKTCPLCLNAESPEVRIGRIDIGVAVSCSVCGYFRITEEAWDFYIDPKISKRKVGKFTLAALSHRIVRHNNKNRPTIISTEIIEEIEKSDQPLPTVDQQADALIEEIGLYISKYEEFVENFSDDMHRRIGASSRNALMRLAIELKQKGLLELIDRSHSQGPAVMRIRLTMDGWRRFNEVRRGLRVGHYGFVALAFGFSNLDNLVENHIKQPVAEELGYDIITMKDVPEAGIIDNIMREKIRDSAFVIADLTHDNSGAYWEAGYAEGLGKPVVYICNESKFSDRSTHFDTNHCTTVMWRDGENHHFSAELIATLRRSLNLF
ncbi:nucleoside 2-deoxyribosyltransferase [Minwuia thermotolerans]|uniref:nucleoside 2-deoxyribosyltransferase n=1 Tax=Minwuia thermotolerans TaxID=2056226 RepID=UPI000F62E45A|nr:nucleoside 2-deoxyribosyltransferase [Minwuia thermotolerans]